MLPIQFLEFDEQLTCSPILEALQNKSDAQFENGSNWATFAPRQGEIEPVYILSNLRKSPNDLDIIATLIETGSKFIVIENSFAVCNIQTGACFDDKSIIYCCNFGRIEQYRLLYQNALLTIFTAQDLFQKTHHMIGASLHSHDIESDPVKIASKIVDHITVHHTQLPFQSSKTNRVFVYKSTGGLGDFFLALPAMMMLDAYFDTITFGFPPSLAPVFAQGSQLRNVISHRGEAPPDGFDTIIDLDNYPPTLGGHYKIPFPTLNRLYQHASFHYCHAVSTLFEKQSNLSLELPLLKFNSTTTPYNHITIHPGSGFPEKCWPTHRYESLIVKLAEQYPDTLIYIVAQDKDPALFQNNPKLAPGSVRFVINHSITEVIGLISTARVHIGNDSGMTHAAGVLNTPVIALFGSTPPETWGPLSVKKVILTNRKQCPLPCSNAIMKECPDRICINHIPVDSVLEAVSTLLNSAE